jgi:transcriptional regulator with XRE-family HTH domain
MKNPVGEKIKEIRQRKNFSQSEVAEMLSISQSTYAKIEQGSSRLDVERLMALADIFEVDYSELLPVSGGKQIHFTNNQITTGFIEHFYEASKDTYEQHIQHLKEEIAFLRGLLEQRR